MDEALVPRHVDEGDPYAFPLRVREAEVDRDAAPFLFWQSIRIDAGQSRLPVIDVPGRADEEAIHGRKATRW